MMPEGAKILTCQVQNNGICLWAEVDSEAPNQRREIEIIGTGHPTTEANRSYIGTVQMVNGCLVLHVFERL